jgi:U-box domain/C2 domain
LDLTFDDNMLRSGDSSAALLGTMINDDDGNDNDDDDVCCGKNKKSDASNNNMPDEYILGTLIVRVVAARDLNPVVNGGPLGNLFGIGGGIDRQRGGGTRGGCGGGHRQRGGGTRGGGGGGGIGSAGGSAGSANPYASVRFGRTTQRTSEVFDSTNPTWPRGETMYMDVIHPAFTDRLYEQQQEQASSQQHQQQQPHEEEQQQQTSTSTNASAKSPFDFEAAASLSREVAREQNQQQQQQQQNPGDPPQKPPPPPPAAAAAAASVPVSTAASVSSSSSLPRKMNSFEQNHGKNKKKSNDDDDVKPPLPEKPILTIAIFHANEIGSMHKYNPTKGSSSSGDSDDVFLGMAAVDLTMLLTGKTQTFDAWLPLSGTPDEHSQHSQSRSSVRIVCEYEASDDAPQPGDWVRFTGFCHEADLYPFHAGKLYQVEDPAEQLKNSSNNSRTSNALAAAAAHGDLVLLSWTSPEGWISMALVHRFMVVCEQKAQHHPGPMEYLEDEIATLTERILVHSPLVHVVQDAVTRLPDDGLAVITQEVWNGGASLLQRWMQGGIQSIVTDIVHATNVDGHANPRTDDAESLLDTDDIDDYNDEDGSNSNNNAAGGAASSGDESSTDGKSTPKRLQQQKQQPFNTAVPLPNMPACPITGQAMVDPVVAADGHTYERSAIARWLRTSDKSPLTGSVLDHKNLVPNFMLVSSLQEAAAAATAAAAASAQGQKAAASDHHDMATRLNPKMASGATAAAAAAQQHDDQAIDDLILDDGDLLIDEELL